MLKILLLMLIFTVPSYSQNDLSPAARLLVQQAQNETSSSTSSKAAGFNVGVTTRFDGGVTFPLSGFDTCFSLFNVTSLEFYIPGGGVNQILATFRFSSPMIEDYHNDLDGLYKMRLGFGIGISSYLFDRRDSLGRGMLVTANALFAMDMMFLNDDVNRYEKYALMGNYAMYRLEGSLRYNYFIHKNAAVVVGADMGFGVATGYQSQKLGDDGYPVEPLEAYGAYARGIYTFGVTFGFMF